MRHLDVFVVDAWYVQVEVVGLLGLLVGDGWAVAGIEGQGWAVRKIAALLHSFWHAQACIVPLHHADV